MSIPTVQISVVDNGAAAALQIPLSQVQVVLGVAFGGSMANLVPYATRNPRTVATNSGAGTPLTEAAGLICQAGGTAICIGLPKNVAGTATAVVPTIPGSSGSTMTVTLDSTYGAFGDFYVRMKCVTGGTRGTSGIQVQISLDAGRTYGPVLNLGTATTLAIPNTGITINIGAGTLVAGDYWSFSTTAPTWAIADVATALTNLAASQFAAAGWGSVHLVGTCGASDTSSLQTDVEALVAQYIFTRVITEARDALAPTAWGGSGETESAWISSIATAYSGISAKRVCVGAGHYNIPSPFPNAYAGTPIYRRPLAWADAVRRVQVPPQRRGGWVSDGALSSITVDTATDPGDGFVYHDERMNPGLDAARFMSAMVWPRFPGFFIVHENLMAPNGSQYTELPIGNVVDIACDIAYQEGVQLVSSDLKLQSDGTMDPVDAKRIESAQNSALRADMVAERMVSDAFAAIDLSQNVFATKTVKIDVSVIPRGYVDTVNETISLVP